MDLLDFTLIRCHLLLRRLYGALARTCEFRRSLENVLDVAATRVFTESKNQAIAISHHKFALLVNAVHGTLENVGPTPQELRSQGVNASDVEVCVIGSRGPLSSLGSLIRAAEKHLNVISMDDGENGRGRGTETRVLTIPIAGNLKTENIAVVLGGLDDVRHSELRDGRLEARCRGGFSLHVNSQSLRAAQSP
jgi:hypothetical protein